MNFLAKQNYLYVFISWQEEAHINKEGFKFITKDLQEQIKNIVTIIFKELISKDNSN